MRPPGAAFWRCSPGAARRFRPLDRAAAGPRTRRRQRPVRLALFARAADRPRWAQVLVPVSDPEFAAKAAAIVGLYLAPPENAIVLAVDEKPAIQALERAQGYLKLPNGRSLHGQAHEYKRHGNSTLFTALNVATGQIRARHTKRRRRVEFLAFMNAVVADYPDQEIHVVLDNQDPQAQARRLAGPAQERPLPLHPDPRQLAQPGRDLVLDPLLAPSTAPASPRSGSCAKPSMPSSKRTTQPPRPSTGNRPRSIPRGSLKGSQIYDRGTRVAAFEDDVRTTASLFDRCGSANSCGRAQVPNPDRTWRRHDLAAGLVGGAAEQGDQRAIGAGDLDIIDAGPAAAAALARSGEESVTDAGRARNAISAPSATVARL